MPLLNDNFLKLKAGYLFPEIGRRVSAFAAENPDAKIIRLGIGDVTEPLPPAIVEAMHRAVDDMATRESFHGYGPEQGYAFLRDKIVEHDYVARGCDIAADEIFISDGSKCDCGNSRSRGHSCLRSCPPSRSSVRMTVPESACRPASAPRLTLAIMWQRKRVCARMMGLGWYLQRTPAPVAHIHVAGRWRGAHNRRSMSTRRATTDVASAAGMCKCVCAGYRRCTELW